MAISKIPMGDLFEEQYKFALPFNELQLNDAEIAIMSAIMIFNPGTTKILLPVEYRIRVESATVSKRPVHGY